MNAHRPIRSATVTCLLPLLAFFVAGCGPNLFEQLTDFRSLNCCGAVVVILAVIALIDLLGSSEPTVKKVTWGARHHLHAGGGLHTILSLWAILNASSGLLRALPNRISKP